MNMKKGNLPTQEYELINVCMQTVENGTPLTCDDCGRTIFNIATIKGKGEGNTYNVGLSCVKKLLNKSIYFDLETGWEFERKENEWKQAMNNLKWLKKHSEKDLYKFSLYKYDNGKEFRINLTFKKDFGGYKKGYSGGYTAAMSLDKLPLFSEFVKAPQRLDLV